MKNTPICNKPWARIIIYENGDFGHCCYQCKPIGNVRDGPFEAIWNNENAQYVRKALLKGEMPTEFCGCMEAIGSIPGQDKEPHKTFNYQPPKNSKKLSLNVLPNKPEKPMQVIEPTSPSPNSPREVLDTSISDELQTFIKSRIDEYNPSAETTMSWLLNRGTAINERNERKLHLTCKPIYLDVELNNMCNLRCDFCTCIPGHIRNAVLPESQLTLDEIDKLSELFPYAEFMETSKAGEPFMTPDLYMYMLSKVRQLNPFVVIHTTTNGTVISDRLLESLIENKLDHMYVSISGDDDDSYNKVMGRPYFQKVITNIQRIRKAKEQVRSREPFVHFNTQLCKFNDPLKLLDIADEYGVMEVNFVKTQIFNYNKHFAGFSVENYMSPDEIEHLMDRIVEKATRLKIAINFPAWDIKDRQLCGPAEPLYYPSMTKYFDRSLTCPTDAPWFRYCTAMRMVQPCCWSGRFTNWTEHTFDELWNGKYLKNLRERLSSGQYPDVCHCIY